MKLVKSLVCFLVCVIQSSTLAQWEFANQVAPDECLVYSAWSGAIPPEAGTTNEAKLLMAEPEIQNSLAKIKDKLAQLPLAAMRREPEAKQAVMREFAPKLLDVLFSKPGVFFVESVEVKEEEVNVAAGIAFEYGPEVKKFPRQLARLLDGIAEIKSASKTNAIFELVLPESRLKSPIYFAAQDNKLLFACGVSSMKRMLAAKSEASQPPEWLARLDQHHQIEEKTSVGYINSAAVYPLLLDSMGEEAEEFQRICQLLGLEQIVTLSTANGYDEKGIESQARLSWKGEPKGLLTMLGQSPLNPKSLAILPADTLFATSLSFNLEDALEQSLAMMNEYEPGASAQAERGDRRISRANWIRSSRAGIRELRVYLDFVQWSWRWVGVRNHRDGRSEEFGTH